VACTASTRMPPLSRWRRRRTAADALCARECVRRGNEAGIAPLAESLRAAGRGRGRPRSPARRAVCGPVHARRRLRRPARTRRGGLRAPALRLANTCLRPERNAPSWRSGRLARAVYVLLTIESSQAQESTTCPTCPTCPTWPTCPRRQESTTCPCPTCQR
jgi:hypothetical protein